MRLKIDASPSVRLALPYLGCISVDFITVYWFYSGDFNILNSDYY